MIIHHDPQEANVKPVLTEKNLIVSELVMKRWAADYCQLSASVLTDVCQKQ